jgi:F-box protein, helicase, 18
MRNTEILITHDFYLKIFQLSKPVLHYDYILFDEGQDASPAMLDIFLKQKATKVIVGDTHQQIYSWRHAINSLGKVDYLSYHLSTSFRFPQDIANLSTAILSWKRYLHQIEPVKIIGKGKPPDTKTNKATIARTNLGLLVRAISFITEHPDVRYLYFEGNLNSYTYADEGASLYDVLHLFNSRHNRIKDKLIRSMSNLLDLEEYIEKTNDVQLGMMVDIVKEYENEIPKLLKSLKSKHVGDEEKAKAEMIFSTVHRAKGMEYDAVQLVEDFVTEATLERIKVESKQENEINVAKWNEEINLLYVAVTRTRGLLRIPERLLPKNFPDSPHIKIIPAKKETISEQPLPPATPQQPTFYSKPPIISSQKSVKSDYYTEKRLKYENAYEPWTAEREAELIEMYNKGIKIGEIARQFGRTTGAISSRLKKIGRPNFQ